MESLHEEFRKLLADTIYLPVDGLSINEITIIDKAFELFKHKLQDIKTLEDRIRDLSIELANIKAMNDDSDTNYDE
jgi:aconitase B